MKILFLIPYPLKEAPSQRFRFEQYFSLLDKKGIWRVQSFLNSQNWRTFYNSGNTLGKISALLNGFGKRCYILLYVHRYDFVFIHREAAPIGPPAFEWIIAKVFKRKIIYDFDDAIWLTDKLNEHPLEKIIRNRGKVGEICKWAHKISCGNEYLCNYARRFNNNVVLNPTTIDTTLHQPAAKNPFTANDQIKIGWTGSHSTLKYLSALSETFKKLQEKYPQLIIKVIADRPPQLDIADMNFVKWNKLSEIKDLNDIDIGIMPLPDDEWAQGKCGFKALQYMALEIPSVVSAVGVNTKIIDDGVDGFTCQSKEEWITKLKLLIENAELRNKIGKQGRLKVEKSYSVSSNSAKFLSLFSLSDQQ